MASLEFVALVLTGLGLTASIVYYANVLSNSNKTQQMQLETRQAQLLMQIINQWSQPAMVEARDFYARLEITSFDEFVKMLANHETMKILRRYMGWLEGIGVLVRENYLDIKVIARLMFSNVTRDWEAVAPYIRQYREEQHYPRAFIEFEYLYKQLIKYKEEHPEIAT